MVVRRLLGPFAGRGPLPALLVLAALVLALLPGRAAVADEEPQEPVVPFLATEVTRAAARITYGDRVTVAGQVVFTDPLGETTYAVDDAEVTLERRYLREDTWTPVAASRTGTCPSTGSRSGRSGAPPTGSPTPGTRHSCRPRRRPRSGSAARPPPR